MLSANPTSTPKDLASGTSIHDLLDQLALSALDNRDKGDKLERLMKAYLQTDPMYAEKYSNVWLWKEWPGRGNQPDTGIDLVAQERDTGDLVAIQCKFYEPGHYLAKSDIDSFFTASGKQPFKSRIIISTTDKWSLHAEQALEQQQIPVTRLRVRDLADSPVDWSQFSFEKPEEIRLRTKKSLRPHQRIAHQKVTEGLSEAERGKLIMACGTGKTFTSLKIAESMAGAGKRVLFLVPSLSLLSQTLREWTGDAEVPLRCFAVCSDSKIGRGREDEDLRVHDLAFPSTTDPQKLHEQASKPAPERMTVVFSTYQSIQVVSDAQALGMPEFDLIISDEAHRTTGATLQGEERSHFTKVHDNDIVRGKKRLYMTATPRLYSDDQVTRAAEKEALLWSMDDPEHYGEELHRLNFGEAVAQGLLSDYKVMILAVDEKHVTKTFQAQLADANNELSLDDAVKIVGCWNGLAKRTPDSVEDDGLAGDTAAMKRAVAFAGNIKTSKRIAGMFTDIVEEYLEHAGDDDDLLYCEAAHVDGTFNVLERNNRLDWLKAPTPDNTCRILTNARCLSEGVDVPSLDAVMFLQPRDSEIDIVQAVGRVMRKAPGKKYGYVILPIGIPAGMSASEALADNQKYKVVWQVLQALRAHDERFDSTVNKIELNKKKPKQIDVIGVGGGSEEREGDTSVQDGFAFELDNIGEWRDAIYAKIVEKVGNRRYWESWAKDVAHIAQRHIDRIQTLLEDEESEHAKAFEDFLAGLRRNLNPAVSRDEAIEMLSQHLITRPVFEALFEDYSFSQYNPVSAAMQRMVDLLEEQALEKETESLEGFYESVRENAKGIDNAEGKQRIIVELYDKFFRTAFPRMADRLGIVYTPIEVVDFIIHSAEHALREEFGASISDEGVHVLDPFTGTGTFMVRLLQSGLIKPEDLAHKYRHELHANEIVLLAYYIAAINIEETYHSLAGGEYQPFEGIVLTDTFQMTEDPANGQAGAIFPVLPENSERAEKQKAHDIRVVIANPPYSAGQDSANDDNQNLKYPKLDEAIANTYAAHSTAGYKNSLYDSYIRAFRWASDRIKDKGVICFVTNGSFIDGNAADGMRKTLVDEFSSIYVFNLRGNQRTSGETSRREGGKIFDSGSRATIAITLLVKNPAKQTPGDLHYYDIGDYLSREQKLAAIEEFGSVVGIPWRQVAPNARHDWINQRGEDFQAFQVLGDKRGKDESPIFATYSLGLSTNRDAWVYNFSQDELARNVDRMIDFYNTQVDLYEDAIHAGAEPSEALEVVSNDAARISWSVNLKKDLMAGRRLSFKRSRVFRGSYRPFTKQHVYFDKDLNERPGLTPRLFPTPDAENRLISVTGVSASKPFSALMTDSLPNLDRLEKGQNFPLYYYDEADGDQSGLFSEKPGVAGRYVRRSAITDDTLASYRHRYGDSSITKEDIFYYVYGVLHSPEYRDRFDAELRKELPRIPFTEDFWAFSRAGRELGEIHVNYESQTKHPVTVTTTHSSPDSAEALRVDKMRFPRKDKQPDKSAIIYNKHVTISDIPLKAYEYEVNGKSAVEWIMDRYQVKVDKSGIKNDPNEWSDNPSYILDLLQRIIHVSLETVRIVNALPPLDEKSLDYDSDPVTAIEA